ncbi:MAG TPA: hypothetical protein VNY51_10290 [Candidatus Dormibacteraeota bacterium]|nr:hypothetical protein [Candidatus Dormibacteraeota bacterium]
MFDPIYLATIYRLTAVNFWESAKIVAASLETKSDGTPAKVTAIPFYFLVSHAAELLLKSALLKRGFPETDLKKFDYGHNLDSLLERLQEKGVSVTSDTAHLIKGLHSQHQNHALRYTALVDDGRRTYMPPPATVFSMLEELLLLTRISTQGV